MEEKFQKRCLRANVSNNLLYDIFCLFSWSFHVCVSHHTAGTRPGPWGGHRGNWDDEQDPTSLTPTVAFLLPWRWSPVLSSGVNLAPQKPLTFPFLTLQFPPQSLSNTALEFNSCNRSGEFLDSFEKVKNKTKQKTTDLLRWDVKGLVWTGSSVSWIFWKYNIQDLMKNKDTWTFKPWTFTGLVWKVNIFYRYHWALW